MRKADGIDTDWIASGKLQFMVEEKLSPARASRRSLSDSKNEGTKN